MRISVETYQRRRQKLQSQLPDKGVAMLRAGGLCSRNSDCDYEFRPNSDFYYLTGFPEPDAWLLLSKTSSFLVSLPKDKEKELWDGFRYGVEGAIEQFGFDDAATLTELDACLDKWLDGVESVWFPFADDSLLSKIQGVRSGLVGKVRAGAQPPSSFHDLGPILAEMRLIKDPEEIRVMEQAAQISVKAHTQAMLQVHPGMKEYELEAELNYVFMKSGARTPAYNNIVASGANACTLHYVKNDEAIQDGDLVLIDAGCELSCYASDITRTFPANGRFSEEQAALYQLVLDAQKAAIAKVQVGAAYQDFHDEAVRVLTSGLVDLGLLQGDVAKLIEDKAFRRFYMHNTGHWLGLDVHDAGLYKIEGVSRPLLAGMVVTVEPGLYIAADDDQVEERWRGIGIRIEDDVVVTDQGPFVLTHGLAKEIDEIESLMAQAQQH